MKAVAVVSRKGGSGKTTLACSLAVAATENGCRVLVLDADPQGTADAWMRARSAACPDLASVVSAAEIRAAVSAARGSYDLVLIDTLGSESASNAVLRAADFCLVPSRPTVPDLLAAPQTMAAARLLGKAAAFVLTQVPSRGHRRASEASRGLAAHGRVSPHCIALRNAYADAQALGLGVTEFEPRGKAAAEIQSLWAWLRKELESVE